MRHAFFSYGIIRISVWGLFGCVWLGGTLYFFHRYYKRKAEFRRYLVRYGKNISNQEPYKTMMAEICGKRKNPLWVVSAPYYGAPMQFGTFQPYIVIPGTMEFSDEELYYVLRHETAHYYHHDALLKDAVSFIRAIYWWNGLCKKLEEKTDLLLEMRVDDKLIDGDETTREAYCRILDHISERVQGKSSIPGVGAAISMASNKNKDLEYRESMMHSERGQKSPWFYLLSAVVAAVYVASYCFILEAYTTAPQHEEIINVTYEGLYAIPGEDGTYDVYLDGAFIENTDTLELYIGISIKEEK